MQLQARGTVLGVARRESINRKTGEAIPQYFLVLQSPKSGGIEGQTIDAEFRLTRKQIEQKRDEELEKLKGKTVTIEVFAKHRAWNDRVYSDWFIAGDASAQAI